MRAISTGYTQIRATISPFRSCPHLAPLYFSDTSSRQVGGSSTVNKQMSHRYELSLVMSTHRARYHDYTCHLRESAAMQPVPVPVLHPAAGYRCFNLNERKQKRTEETQC